MLVGIDTIKCFLGKMGERYSFKMKPDSQEGEKISSKLTVNKVMETKMTQWAM